MPDTNSNFSLKKFLGNIIFFSRKEHIENAKFRKGCYVSYEGIQRRIVDVSVENNNEPRYLLAGIPLHNNGKPIWCAETNLKTLESRFQAGEIVIEGGPFPATLEIQKIRRTKSGRWQIGFKSSDGKESKLRYDLEERYKRFTPGMNLSH